MATAPTPGQTHAAEERELFERSGLAIELGEGINRRRLELMTADLGPADDLRSRNETGFPVSAFLAENRFGTDAILVLWWIARTKNGEPRLRFAQVLKEFPTLAALQAANPEIFELEDDRKSSGEIELGDSPE